MISFQSKLIGQLESIATLHQCELVQTTTAANCGRLLAQRRAPASGSTGQTTVAFVDYHFQNGHNKLLFNGVSIGPADMSALFSEQEDAKVNSALQKWGTLIREGKNRADHAGGSVASGPVARVVSPAPGIISAREQHAAGINR